jgi:hypothetical protein
LLQLISINDISFPTKVQEVQYQPWESTVEERVNIGNINNEDWSNRDSFRYVINSFSINSNKVINLLENIKEINVYCDFYAEKNISTFIPLAENEAFSFKMWTNTENEKFEITKANVTSQKEYVTKEVNDGIEWVKIRVEISYIIGEQEIVDVLTSDWIETDADII